MEVLNALATHRKCITAFDFLPMPGTGLRMFNAAFGQYLRWRVPRLERTRVSPYEFQERWLDALLIHGRHTSFGKEHGLRHVHSYEQFRENIPVRDYDGHAPYIHRMLEGERSVLWPGFVRWFSKSSGTTSDRSKYIPVPGDNLRKNHLRGGWDALSLYYDQRPDADLFLRKNLVMGGSIQETRPSGVKIGDISAVMLSHFPAIGRPFYTPSLETMLLKGYENKLEATAQESSRADVGMIGGVPNWTMILMRRILDITGANNMKEVWPNFRLFTHGGISFAPYRAQFEQLIGPGSFDFLEIYNASEGYLGLRDDLSSDDMLLLLDSGVFYEFMPKSEWDKEFPHAVPLHEVEVGETYGVVISTNAGLWRYNLGDTIRFTSKAPYKFKITGRTKQFINTFGEEVMVTNTDRALELTCKELNCTVLEYTVAPKFIVTPGERGAHEWLVEFSKPPHSLRAFAKTLDENLQQLNSDYAAKRRLDMVLTEAIVHAIAPGTFHNWMASRGKIGGQSKVPRLSNSREYVDALLKRVDVTQVSRTLQGY